MKVVGSKHVALSKLKGPGDIKKRMREPHVIELARSMRDTVPLQDIVVRKDFRIIAGRDRYAAHVLNETPKVWVKVVECDNDEAKRLERHENIFRRHNAGERAELLSRLSDEVTEELTEQEERPPVRRFGERSARAKAREVVAQQAGVKPDAVRQAEYRAKKKAAQAEPEPPKVRSVGMALTPEFSGNVGAIHRLVSDAAGHMARALGLLTKLEKLPFPNGRLQAIRQVVEDASHRLRAALPESLCPACKGIAAVQEKCAGCAGTAWISKSQTAGVPARLWDEEQPMVLQDGKLVPAEDFFEDVF